MDYNSILTKDLEIPSTMKENWQQIVNLIAEIFDIPASLIMRVEPPQIEVFISSKSKKNPYEPGEKAELPGLYCNQVIKSREKLLVPNALEDPVWDKNPDIALNMISYLGYPIIWPTGEVFGTICVLDTKPNEYNSLQIRLLGKFRTIVENNLELLVEKENLQKAHTRINNLENVLPICSFCKKIRNSNDEWINIERYISEASDTKFSHSVCPKCQKIHY
ncbi:MAG: GAF domain-containing protein [Promethearchaeota archaeon]